MLDNPFIILGLRRGASPAEVKRAFRRLAMTWHPDRNPAREAEERFKQIRRAYELLLDPGHHADWASRSDAEEEDEEGAPTEAPEDDAETPPHAPRPADHVLNLSLEEAAFGCEQTITLREVETCLDCHGSGRIEYTRSVACTSCGGCGRLRSGRSGTCVCGACGGRGFVRSVPCPRCDGVGHRSHERPLRVRIPAGIRCGEQVHVRAQTRGRGQAGNDELLIEIMLEPHPLFTLDGHDLVCTVPVSILALLAGAEIEIPTLAGTQRVAFAPFTGEPVEHRLRGLGFPRRHARGAGDLRVKLQPVFPQALDAESLQQLNRLDARAGVRDDFWPADYCRWQGDLARRRQRR